jgi:hypothetical protein
LLFIIYYRCFTTVFAFFREHGKFKSNEKRSFDFSSTQDFSLPEDLQLPLNTGKLSAVLSELWNRLVCENNIIRRISFILYCFVLGGIKTKRRISRRKK